MPLRITSIALFFIAASPLPACADPQNTASETSLRTTLHQAVVTVPMDNWGGRPLVHTRVNGKGPFRLLLDTGTTFAAVLSEDLLEELEVPRSGPAPTMGTMGEDDVVELETIVMGDAEFSKIRVGRADFSGFMPPGPATPVGILGLSLFKDCLLTLDYPNRTVVFESGELPPADDDTIEYSSEEDRDYGITIALSVAGTRTKVHLDTGSPGFLTRMALPPFLGLWRTDGAALGAQRGHRDARALIPPGRGIDFCVHASVKTRLHLSREPSLAMIPARRPSLASRANGSAKEGRHVILQTVTLITRTISFDPGLVSSTTRSTVCRRPAGRSDPGGV